MPVVNNVAQLKTYVESQMKRSMMSNRAVVNLVIQTGKEKVQTEVYDAYEPMSYERTYELKNSWDVIPTTDGLAVFNSRTDGDTDIPQIIETGKGYSQNTPMEGTPRPFVQATVNALKGSSALTKAYKDDLRAAGIRTV